MKAEEIKIVVLTAKEGYKITQAGEVDKEDRIFVNTLYLGKYDSLSNYKEISDEEINTYM